MPRSSTCSCAKLRLRLRLRLRRGLCTGAAVALLCGSAAAAVDVGSTAGTSAKVNVRSWKQLRFAATVHQQYDFSCGSAALATLLSHHYRYPVSEALVFSAMFAAGDQPTIRRQGFSLLDMQRFLRSRGFQADGFELPLEKLAAARLPAIVLIADQGYRHFVVLKGVADGRVLLGDPAAGTRALSIERFRQLWSNKLLFVIHGSTTTPSFNDSADWRAAPSASLGQVLDNAALTGVPLPKFGPGDF